MHGGSFKTLKDAKARRDLIGGELAGGRNPALLLGAIAETPVARTFATVYDAFAVSRVDVAEGTKENYRTSRIRLVDLLGDRDPATITWQDVQEVVTSLSAGLSPLTVRNYLGTLRQVLDFADLGVNVARDRRVKLPRPDEAIPNPPSGSEVAAIIANAPHKWRLAIRVLEQTGMRVGEIGDLEWGDVDRANLRLRIRVGTTNAARRWIPIPEWLMEEIEGTCPPDDRTAVRRVFPGAGRQTVGNAMRNACKTAGLAAYSPHDLRHRYISVKLREGVPITEIAAHVGTHERASRWTRTRTSYSTKASPFSRWSSPKSPWRCGPGVISTHAETTNRLQTAGWCPLHREDVDIGVYHLPTVGPPVSSAHCTSLR